MQKKEWNKFVLVAIFVFSLCSMHTNYGVVAYMPVELRDCLSNIYEINGKDKSSYLDELYSIIKQNRIIVSDQVIRRVVVEALDILRNNDNFNHNWRDGAAVYLQNYLDALNNKSILCSLQGEGQASISIPNALLARSLEIDSMSKDIMYLSGQLTNVQSIALCGNDFINADFSHFMPTHSTDMQCARASLIFNADMMSSSGSSSPNIVFGTGMNTPVVTAWAMPSNVVRQVATRAPMTPPVTLQFSIPTDFQKNESVSLKVHFLVEKQGFPTGKARIQIDALYVGNNDQFELTDTTHTDRSESFTVREPNNDDEFRHVYVSVPLQKSHIEKDKFAMISISRIMPHGMEYAGDIYLVAAEFKYSEKEDECRK